MCTHFILVRAVRLGVQHQRRVASDGFVAPVDFPRRAEDVERSGEDVVVDETRVHGEHAHHEDDVPAAEEDAEHLCNNSKTKSSIKIKTIQLKQERNLFYNTQIHEYILYLKKKRKKPHKLHFGILQIFRFQIPKKKRGYRQR